MLACRRSRLATCGRRLLLLNARPAPVLETPHDIPFLLSNHKKEKEETAHLWVAAAEPGVAGVLQPPYLCTTHGAPPTNFNHESRGGEGK